MKSEQEIQLLNNIGTLLSYTAFSISDSNSKFSTWIMLGFGSYFSLIFANLNEVKEYIPISSIKVSALIFFTVLVMGIIQRLFTTRLNSANSCMERGKDIKIEDSDLPILVDELKKSFYWPVRLIADKHLDEIIKNNDPAATGRSFMRMAQKTSLLVVLQFLLSLISIFVIIWGLEY